MLKCLLVSLLLFLLPLRTFSPIANANSDSAVSEAGKKELEKAVDNITFAIIEGDVDELMKFSHLDAAFQFEKKRKLSQFLLRYNNNNHKVSSVEIAQIKITSAEEAKVMVKVNLSAMDVIGGLGAAPRAEVWRFVKGQEGETRGEWLLLIED